MRIAFEKPLLITGNNSQGISTREDSYIPRPDSQASFRQESLEGRDMTEPSGLPQMDSYLMPLSLGTGTIAVHRLQEIFSRIARPGSDKVTRADLIKALRTDSEVRRLVHLPKRIRDGQEEHTNFELLFQHLEAGGERTITWAAFLAYFLDCTVSSRHSTTIDHSVPPAARRTETAAPPRSPMAGRTEGATSTNVSAFAAEPQNQSGTVEEGREPSNKVYRITMGLGESHRSTPLSPYAGPPRTPLMSTTTPNALVPMSANEL